jgi:putative PIN family toxin of toxin-antitoxin system
MRIVIDTNVFISATLKDRSVPALAVHLAVQKGTVLKSAATAHQLNTVLARPNFTSLVASATREWLQSIMDAAEPVEIVERIVACRDPTDDKFLEVAVNGDADIILSGDQDLLVLNPFRGCLIVPPATFLKGGSR